MSNPNEFPTASAEAGSATNGADKGAGTPIDQEQFKNLETLVGKQGQELGEYRQFFADVSPLLDKLDKSPELVKAIIDGKIDEELGKAALEGKITLKDAVDITTAHDSVKKEIGAKAYEKASAEDINKLVDEKFSALRGEFTETLKSRDEISSFESSVNDFIANTPDFAEYAKSIDAWLDEHDITDIKVAYYAVKGELSESAAKKLADQDKAEYEKNVAMNAGGGNSRVTYTGDQGASMIDSLVAGKSNPNIFG